MTRIIAIANPVGQVMHHSLLRITVNKYIINYVDTRIKPKKNKKLLKYIYNLKPVVVRNWFATQLYQCEYMFVTTINLNVFVFFKMLFYRNYDRKQIINESVIKADLLTRSIICI